MSRLRLPAGSPTRPRRSRSSLAMRAGPIVGAALLVAACSGSGVPSSSAAPGPSAPAPTGLNPAAPPQATSPSPGPMAVPAGAPWLLHDRFVDDGVKGIFLVRPDGTDDHRILADAGGDVRAMTWSSDGSRIAFVYDGPGAAKDGEIWTAASDGSGAAKLVDGSPDCSGAFYPAWSPGDAKLAFVCYTSDGNGSLDVLDFKTKAVTQLLRVVWPEVFDNPPRWSPNGSTIAFDILHWDPTNSFLDGSLIATIPATGGNAEHLTAFPSFAAYPDWRPDGKELVFNTYDQGNMVNTDHASNLFAIGLDGKGPRQITTASKDGSYRITQPRWDPSGRRLWATIWQRQNTITFGWVDPSTGAVTDLGIMGSRPQPRPLP